MSTAPDVPRPVQRLAYSVEEAGSAIGLSRQSIYRLIDSGAIRARVDRHGKRIILASDLEAYLRSLPVLEPRKSAQS